MNKNKSATTAARPRRVDEARQMMWVLIGSIIATILLYLVPLGRLIGRPLVLFSTYAHEMGHGMMALAVGGKFIKFQMWPNGSGLATTALPASTSGISSALVSLGGLVGPALLSMLLFMLATRPRWARATMSALGIICALSVVLVVRNLFGVIFVSACAAVIVALGLFASARLAHFSQVFLGTQLALAVFSSTDYLFTDTAHTAAGNFPSDVANIANALGMPYWFWGGLIALLSAGLLSMGCWVYYRALQKPKLSAASS